MEEDKRRASLEWIVPPVSSFVPGTRRARASEDVQGRDNRFLGSPCQIERRIDHVRTSPHHLISSVEETARVRAERSSFRPASSLWNQIEAIKLRGADHKSTTHLETSINVLSRVQSSRMSTIQSLDTSSQAPPCPDFSLDSIPTQFPIPPPSTPLPLNLAPCSTCPPAYPVPNRLSPVQDDLDPKLLSIGKDVSFLLFVSPAGGSDSLECILVHLDEPFHLDPR